MPLGVMRQGLVVHSSAPLRIFLSYIKIQSVAKINKIELVGGAKGGIDSLDIGTSNADLGTNVTTRLDMWLFPF